MATRAFFVGALVLTVSAIACGSSDTEPTGQTRLASCVAQTHSDSFKEVIIVDDGVFTGDETKNRLSGHWSFRYLMEQMAPAGKDPSQFVLAWLQTWLPEQPFNGQAVDPREPRAQAMMSTIICPWLKRTTANACNEDCSTCTAENLDLGEAPFRTIGVVDRIDLRETINPRAQGGEGRFVVALTDGPADDGAKPLAMTVNFEYALPNSATTTQWAEAWHALGKHTAFDGAFKAELMALTERFAARNAAPASPNGSSLGQIRTNESALDWIWQLREFHLDGATGNLQIAALANTPLESLNNSGSLADYVKTNASDISANRYAIPPGLLTASTDETMFRWQLPGVDEVARREFAQGTCNGCHATENPSKDTVFHVSPFRVGVDRLSPFLYNPAQPGKDELSRRTDSLKRALCGS
jgi:hypothetical protein